MKIGFFLLMLTSSVFAQEYKIHILKEGETLSEILQYHGYSPLWGEDKWVQRTLEMNHLSSLQDKDLKKGFPIILPSKVKPTQEKITYKSISSQPKRYGLFSSLISDHQDVYFIFDYSRKTMKLNNTQISLNDNFSLALEVEGNNNYKFNQLTYNFNGHLNIVSHGVGRFSNNQTRTMNLEPTYEVKSEMEITHSNIPFTFGPTVAINEKSIAFEEDEQFETRRDQSLWIGANIKKKFYFKNNVFHSAIKYERIFGQNALTANSEYGASQASILGKVNITESYIAGLEFASTQYRDTDLKREESVGINFSYMIK